MFHLLYAFLSVCSSHAGIEPWLKVALVEVPGHRCLPLELDRRRSLCVSDSTSSEGHFTHFVEIRIQEGIIEKRAVFEVRDTSQICKGGSQAVGRFFGFETRDVDQDGRLDPVVLIRAGKLKRRGLEDGVCSEDPIGTAIYEVSFRNGPKGLEEYEPSYPVIQRLQKLAVVR